MADRPRLIEVAFPLKETSIDSVHEKNVRHGHISTLHIWPARRPLAACRAALIATLLPDPGDAAKRAEILAKMGGKVVTNKKTGKEETEGGILHWGRESGPDMDWFREKIRDAYGGRAPRVLDPFSGGGAIPLEAMRLGCDVTAVDINPVAWFILKCTLEYPQKLAGKTRPLPEFVLRDKLFMTAFLKAQGHKGPDLSRALDRLGFAETGKTIPMSTVPGEVPNADLAWHVRAWGHWVLTQARKDLEGFYPVIDDKPTVAYLWARTVRCKDCGASVPLLKTRWLSKRDDRRVVLTTKPNADRSGVDFGIKAVDSTAVRDKKMAAGTMSRSGAQCLCCPAIMTMEDIRLEGCALRLGTVMTAVVVEGLTGKEYRQPTPAEISAATLATGELEALFERIPLGIPTESISTGSIRKGGVSITRWGITTWRDMFLDRQLLGIGTLLLHTRAAREQFASDDAEGAWTDAILVYLALVLDRAVNYLSKNCIWESAAAEVKQTFLRFALPITWDFAESNPLCPNDRYYAGALSGVCSVLDGILRAQTTCATPVVHRGSAIGVTGDFDIVVTDPPYYDAIPYADLMDFFYVWLRRTLIGLSPNFDAGVRLLATPKWDVDANDGELVDDESRFGGDSKKSKMVYEDGMFRALSACHSSLRPDGRLVIVFANKEPDAWEALVSAVIRAGFAVDGTWPIATEMRGGVRNAGRASLASSVWIVCKMRPASTRSGWDNRVLEGMRERIYEQMKGFWDAGIRGPDFVWAATGPALEAYSKYPVVKKANEPGQSMIVSEFLRHVRRIVVDFVVGRVLTGDGGTAPVTGLDDVTTYYILHRHDFGLGDAAAGACILYAVSCGLSDRDLSDRYEILVRTGGKAGSGAGETDDEDADGEDAEAEVGSGSGNKVKLRTWEQRRGKNLGVDVEGKPAPLVDKVHRILQLWRIGEVAKVDEYLDANALWKSPIFHQFLQALVELAAEGSEERSLLESISNHVGAPGRPAPRRQLALPASIAQQDTGE